jgi:ribosomal protein L11 methyltransferase
MNNYIQISFKNIQAGQKDILIARLADAGYDGFEETGTTLDAFIAEENFDKSGLEDLTAIYKVGFTKTEIKSENWNKVWESNFHPVVVDDFVAVRADFHEPIIDVEYEIIITPKMSFGTGHHATTNMMMRQMRTIDFKNKSVFDFGTGTGILAILAHKSGAASVTVIDNDEWSIENAEENFQKNNCDSIVLKQRDTALTGQTFDIILANITKNIILENFSILSQQLNKNATLLLSGLLEDDEEDIVKESSKYSLLPGTRLKEGNWLCLRFLR